MKISTDISAAEVGRAIESLRLRLGMTQKVFARMIDSELEARMVQRWEAGEGFPSGDRLLKMLRNCDKESLAKFGIDVGRYVRVESVPAASSSPLKAPTEKEVPAETVSVSSRKEGYSRKIQEHVFEPLPVKFAKPRSK